MRESTGSYVSHLFISPNFCLMCTTPQVRGALAFGAQHLRVIPKVRPLIVSTMVTCSDGQHRQLCSTVFLQHRNLPETISYLFLKQHRPVGEATGEIRVVGTKSFLPNCDRSQVEWVRLFEFALSSVIAFTLARTGSYHY